MNAPIVREITLNKHYSFQYENFVLATQNEVYLLLEKEDALFRALRFKFSSLKYGGPNDEARGNHPLAKHGLGFYGFYQVENSPWIQELMIANRVHPRHLDSMYSGKKHFIACFKDTMLEVIRREYEEVRLSQSDLVEVFQEQLRYLE
jgi:hypothetical protein